MKRLSLKASLGYGALALFMVACSSTSILQSWKAEDALIDRSKLTKIMVSVASVNESARRVAEDRLVSKNNKFMPSYTIFTTPELAKDTTRAKLILKEMGVQGILSFRLMSNETSTTYVPPTTGMGYNYWGYYGNYWGAYYQPGYYVENQQYIVECRYYSLVDNELLWTGVTKTLNPGSIESAVDDMVVAIYERMKRDGLFKL